MTTKKTSKKKARTKKTAKRPVAKKRPAKNALSLKPGTKLTRTFKGNEISVDVTAEGFVYEDQTYQSISAVARRITGYMVSGPVFFGLNKDAE